MHIISKKALQQFWQKHPTARGPLEVWYRLVNAIHFTNFSALKHTFNSADYVPPHTVFDIAGNNFRIIAVIHYNRQKLYVREVFTHAEYDQWSKANQRTKS